MFALICEIGILAELLEVGCPFASKPGVKVSLCNLVSLVLIMTLPVAVFACEKCNHVNEEFEKMDIE